MLNKIFSLFLIFIGFSLFTLLAFIGYDNAAEKLSDYKQIENKVIKTDIVKSDKNSKIFNLKILGSEENFGIYKMTKDYSNLEKNIKVGDIIKIYFKPSNSKSKNYNFDVVQIEKENKILLNQNDYRIKNYILMSVGILAALFMIYVAFSIIKYGKFENPIPTIF